MSTGEKSATTSFEEKDGGKLLSSVPLKYEDTLLTIQHVATPYEGDAQDATSLAGSALREPTISRSLVHFCKESWLNLLFVFVPVRSSSFTPGESELIKWVPHVDFLGTALFRTAARG